MGGKGESRVKVVSSRPRRVVPPFPEDIELSPWDIGEESAGSKRTMQEPAPQLPPDSGKKRKLDPDQIIQIDPLHRLLEQKEEEKNNKEENWKSGIEEYLTQGNSLLEKPDKNIWTESDLDSDEENKPMS